MKPHPLLREYEDADLPGVIEVYSDAVRKITPGLYTPEQVEAWAAFAETGDQLAPLLAQGYRLVIESEAGIDAFAVLDPADYVSLLYCRARAFGRVHACDLSANLLARARLLCRDFDNVDFLQTDLGRVAHPFDPVDFVLCVNVLIMAGLDARMGALRAVTAQVKSGGHLLLVTPSTESMLYTQFRRIDWCLREGMDCDVAIRDSVPVRGSVRDLHQGIRPIDGMPTKHHLREELLVLLRGHEMEILSIEKLTYPWTTEFRDPPTWMEGPFPWDWLVLARRK